MTSAPKSEHKSFRLGQWRVDPNANSVSSGTVKRQLEPRAMDVLLFLVQHPKTVVSSSELLEVCWKGTFQGDNAVHKIITQLRRAFDDPSNEPRYIETIRKRGYRILAELVYEDEAGTGSWLHESPFRGLEAFEEQHAAIFFGRTFALRQLIQTTLAQVQAGHAMVLLLGPSGSGKTSLIRAGLISQLTGSTNVPGLALACHLVLDLADLGNSGLFQSLGSVLLDCEVDGQLLFEHDSAQSLGQRLAEDTDGVVAELQSRLALIRVVLVIDRLEAIFRMPQLDDTTRQRFVLVLDQLARSGCLLLVLACRNDFYPQLANYPVLMDLKRRGGHFDLEPPKSVEMSQIILQPARAAQLRFGVDEASGERLDDALCDAARASADSLPLLQYCLQELYRRRSPDGELSFAVFKELGGIEGALGQRAEQVFSALAPAHAAALPRLLAQLVIVTDDDFSVTSQRLAWSALDGQAETALVKHLVDARLFVSDLHGGVPAFGIAHEALLRRWPRVVAWIETHRRALQLHSGVRRQAARWEASGRSRDMLLPRGTQARQAQDLLAPGEFMLSSQEQAFIRTSLQRIRRFDLLRMSALAMLIGLAALASGLFLAARAAQQQAEANRVEAEGLMTYMLGEFVDQLRPLGRLGMLDSVSARAMAYLSGAENAHANATVLSQRAKALQVISEVNIARAEPAQAAQALGIAGTILQQQLRDAPDDVAILKSAGENAFWLGRIYYDQKDWPRAQQYFNEYRALSDRLAAARPDDIDGWIEQSYAHNTLGTLALQRGDVARGAAEFTASVALKERALAKAPGDSLASDLADSLSWLASTEERRGEFARATSLYGRELELASALHEKIPANARWSNDLASALSHQGALKRLGGDEDGAQAEFNRAASLLKTIVSQDPSNRTWQRNLHTARLEQFDGVMAHLAEAPALARLTALQSDFLALSKLEPKKIILRLALAKVSMRQAYVKNKYSNAQAAKDDIMAAVATLEDLLRQAPADQSVRDALADALMLQSKIDTALGNTSLGRASCAKVQALLAPLIVGSADFHVLVPWIRAHQCLGEATKVSTQKKLLEKLQSREPSYLRHVSPFHNESNS